MRPKRPIHEVRRESSCYDPRNMSLRKAVLLTVLPWTAGISLLHAGLNLDLFRRTEGPEKSFKVGFLPVT